MAKFIDGSGQKHSLTIKNIGQLEDLEAKYGIALDTVFMEDAEAIGQFLYGDMRKLARFAAAFCNVTGEDEKAFIRSFDAHTHERCRRAILEALSDFCHPPHAGEKFKSEEIPKMLAAFSPPDWSNEATKSVA